MKTYYVSKTRNLLTDPVITDYKIGNKEDLIDYIANQFNINKNIINFKFGKIRKIEDIHKMMKDNRELDIDNIKNIFNENIIIKIDSTTQLHIHRYISSQAFQIWVEPINTNDHYMQESFNDFNIFYWKEE